jgi:hypothetical protein
MLVMLIICCSLVLCIRFRDAADIKMGVITILLLIINPVFLMQIMNVPLPFCCSSFVNTSSSYVPDAGKDCDPYIR